MTNLRKPLTIGYNMVGAGGDYWFVNLLNLVEKEHLRRCGSSGRGGYGDGVAGVGIQRKVEGEEEEECKEEKKNYELNPNQPWNSVWDL